MASSEVVGKFVAGLMLSFHLCCATATGEEKIREAIEKGADKAEILERITEKDIPAKWKVIRKVKEDQNRVVHTFFRGDLRVLEVSWRKEWTGAKGRMLVAAAYDGDTPIVRIMGFTDSTSVVVKGVPANYSVVSSLRDDGTFSLKLMNQDKGFLEEIIIKGRDTRPIDDLAFTKMALGMEQILAPLLDATQEQAEKKAERK